MAARNVFEIMQAELYPQNDSDDNKESSEDEYVTPESFDSDEDAEKDLRERTDEEKIDNSNEDMGAHVTSLIDLTGKMGQYGNPHHSQKHGPNCTTSFGHAPNQQIYQVY